MAACDWNNKVSSSSRSNTVAKALDLRNAAWEHHCRLNWPYRIIPFPKMALKTIIGISISLGEYVNHVGRN